MPLIVDPSQVQEIYAQAAACGMCLANFCTANPQTTEAILAAAHAFGQTHGKPPAPIVVAATGNYPIEPQLRHYTGTGRARVGLASLVADVANLLDADSPYHDVPVLLHFDHALPGLDDDLVPLALGKFATIMWDCSSRPLAENISLVAQFVERCRGRALVEGAVEEVVQAADDVTPRGHLTEPAAAARFLAETGAFLIVPNLGTEHRSTAAVAHYDGDRARLIRDRIGPRMVLHGASSLHDEDLGRLAGDGIVKLNVWSIFERLGGQALAADTVANLGNYFGRERLAEWQGQGLLGPAYFDRAYADSRCDGALGPKGWAVVDYRRRALWQEAVVARMLFYLDRIGYGGWSE